MKINIDYIPINLPISIFDTKNDLVTEEVMEYCSSFYDVQRRNTNVKADMSSYELWKETDVFNSFFEMVSDYVRFHPWHYEMKNWIIKNAWVARYKNNDIARNHNHLPAKLSFIYYIKCTGQPSPLIIEGADEDHIIEAKEGRLLIFPSVMMHRVEPNGDGERLCLAGNIT